MTTFTQTTGYFVGHKYEMDQNVSNNSMQELGIYLMKSCTISFNDVYYTHSKTSNVVTGKLVEEPCKITPFL